ncbi:MAG: hypothetical protein JJT94_15945 [Bernardetiaceae bacterium]|nr:hypothetical protein [Bernardetiaceae bacterium]
MWLFIAFFIFFGINTSEAAPKDMAAAMVRGKLLTQENGQPLHTHLKVLHLESGTQEHNISQPDMEGNYFMFLQAGEFYQVEVSGGAFRPYIFELFIPRYTYYYEIDKTIAFEKVNLLGEELGQRTRILYVSYNLVKLQDSRPVDIIRTRYKFLGEFIEHLINSNDTAVDFDKVLPKATTPLDAVEIPALPDADEGEPREKYVRISRQIDSLIQDPNSDPDLFFKRIDSLQNAELSYLKSHSEEQPIEWAELWEISRLIAKHQLLFTNPKRARISRTQKQSLQEIADFINKEPSCTLDILAFVSSATDDNRRAAAKRLQRIHRYLQKRIDNTEKIRILALASPEDLGLKSETSPEGVEIQIRQKK